MPGTPNTPPGPAVDLSGQTAVDPTKNVDALVAGVERRLDDLRAADEKLRDAQILHIERMMKLQADHDAELRTAESKRIDALRAGDQAAIITLAGTVTATAEAMRGSAADTAEGFNKALAEVQRWQYGLQGGTAQVQTTKADTRSNIGVVVGIIGGVSTVVFLLITLGTILIASRP